MKKLYILLSVITILFIIFFNCQQTGGSGGGGGGDDDTPSKWISESKIVASDAAVGDNFGYSVSISGDYVIVGAREEDGAGSNRGAAYIFHRTGINTWDTVFKITASDAADEDQFGFSVSISGDYAIVGAPYEDGAGTDRGAAYIYHRTVDNIWSEEGKLKASDAADEDYYGCSVSISGDYAIVGALEKDGVGPGYGAVYIHQLSTGTAAKKTASDAEEGDRFGNSVSISGDYIIVGALRENGAGTDRGAAYIFHRTGENTWDTETKITASDAGDGNYFGCSVSISGDYAIVGAYGTGSFKGASYIFHRTAENIWDAGTKLVAFDMEDGDEFGCSVSISGDYAIAGAHYEDGAGTNRGAAYIFHRSGLSDTWDIGTKIVSSDTEFLDLDRFSESVSISGDYAIIGAYEEDSGGTNSGAAYIFK